MLLTLTAWAGNNVLSVKKDLVGSAGKTVFVPFELTNDDEIVAAQFTVTLPFARTNDTFTLNEQRNVNNHSISCRDLGGNKYTIVIVNMENKPIGGNAGVLFSIPMYVGSDAQPDVNYEIKISDVVLTNKKGDNIQTGSTTGILTITSNPSPDIRPVNIAFGKTSFIPEDKISASWTVENIGDAIANGGWTENLFLVSASTGDRVFLGTTRSYATLAKGTKLNRSGEFNVPASLGMHGDVYLEVTLVGNSGFGEYVSNQENNTGRSTGTATLGKKLYLIADAPSLKEDSKNPLRMKLSRSGNWNLAQTFTLKSQNSGLVSIPASVTIPAGQGGVYFYVNAVNNTIVNTIDVETITASGSGYTAVSRDIQIEDDEFFNLDLKLSKSELNEGESTYLNIKLAKISNVDQVITLSTDYPKRFTFPSTVTIPAGKLEANVEIKAVDDNIVDIQNSVAFYAVANHYNKGEVNLLLNDNDVPDLQFEVSPNTISEGAGLKAILATIRRTSAKNSKVTIKLTENSDGALYFSTKTITMEPGVDKAEFYIGAVDNSMKQDAQTYTVTANVYISSCSCNAGGELKGIAEQQITVLDDDSPSLLVSTNVASLAEGSADKAIVTIKRNTGTTGTLTVSLTSDDPRISVPSTITIPAGQESISIEVKAVGNKVTCDTKTVIITAKSDNYADGTCWIRVVDETLPDLVVSNFEVTPAINLPNGIVNVKMLVTNKGILSTNKTTYVKVYSDGEEFYSFLIDRELAPGASITLENKCNLPDKVGTFSVKAVVNPDRSITESVYVNNESSVITVRADAPFTAVAHVSSNTIEPEGTVTISGKIEGTSVANTEVEVYVINMGCREAFKTMTDEKGNYSTNYTPTKGQNGHFSVGACYPGQNLTEELTSFEIIGLRRQDVATVRHELTVGQPQSGSLVLFNPSAIELNNIHVEMIDAPEDVKISFIPIAHMAGGATQTFKYTIEGLSPHTDGNWHNIKFKVTSTEKANFEMSIKYYNYAAHGKIKLSTNNIKTTMTKGESRDYIITVTNIGLGETGKISLNLPADQTWLSSVTPTNMASLNPGETTDIILRLTPSDEMKLNVPVTGAIGINCANGEGISLPFSIETVSETMGTLIVDVCDENTYYTAEKPHVKGATVTITHPTTGALITNGSTGEDGTFSVELPEGYYSVTVQAANHSQYRNNILVDPGKEKRQVVNLSIQAITVDWKVEETTVEDKYEIKTTVKYETNVPVPVVELIIPDKVAASELHEGESLMFMATMTNKGLITAQDVELFMPESSTLKFEILNYNGSFNLAPQQSAFFPVVVTRVATTSNKAKRLAHSSGGSDDFDCSDWVSTIYYWDCGNDKKWHRYSIPIDLGYHCLKKITPSDTIHIIIPYPCKNCGGGIPDIHGWSTWPEPGPYEEVPCTPCQNQKLLNCLAGFIPGLGCLKGIWDTEKELLFAIMDRDGLGFYNTFRDVLITTLGCAEDIATSTIGSVLGCIVSFTSVCEPPEADDPDWMSAKRNAKAKASSSLSYVDEFRDLMKIPTAEVQAMVGIINETFGSDDWESRTTVRENYKLLNAVWRSDEQILTPGKYIGLKPELVTVEEFNRFIERLNNTKAYYATSNFLTENYIHSDKIADYVKIISDCEEQSQKLGYISMQEMVSTEYNKVKERLEESSNSVCASISLELSQTMVLTRQAFRGTLTVFNGNENSAMRDVKLNLEVKDAYGNIATSHEFQTTVESLDKFTGNLSLTDGWTLEAKETGVASVLFIPTKYAAPTYDQVYYFGGTLSYVDPFTGLTVTRELSPVTLTVKPTPELDLTYFMQRDVLGDNPLTKDVVESSVPSEFALLINNKGNGEATNVNIFTDQPKIIDNEKGLLVKFEILSSTVNGKDKSLALGGSVASNIGNIPAKKQAYAQWELKCDLLGHFTTYDVKATHLSSYDNPDLSLLDEVSIHELIRSMKFPAEKGSNDSIVGWLVNDIPDAKDRPDAIYFSDGRVEDVFTLTSDATIKKLETTRYQLVIKPERTGWVYGNIADPTLGRSKIVSVTRSSDGQKISTRNFWQTEWTLRDGAEPLKEYRLHFCDSIANLDDQYYVIEYMPMPDLKLKVASITGPHADKKVEEEPLTQVIVQFNKPIISNTFTYEDLSMRCQGKDVDMKNVKISTNDNQTFTLDLTDATKNDGYYVLKVVTNNITDCEDFYGSEDGKCDWIQFIGGVCKVSGEVWPKNSGRINIVRIPVFMSAAKALASQQYINAVEIPYGDEMKFEATPETGYTFKGWYLGDECVSTDATYTTYCLDHTTLKAVFHENNAHLLIDYNAKGGTVTGAGSGTYGIGNSLRLRAIPADGYVFTGWIKGNDIISTNEFYEFILTSDMEIKAEFVLKGGKLGDVNVDGFITVSDVMALSSIILENEVNGASRIYADVNMDKSISISDIPAINNLILGTSNAKSSYDLYTRRNANGGSLVQMNDVQLNSGTAIQQTFTLEGVYRYTCFQFDIETPAGIDIQNVVKADGTDGHVVEWNRLKNGKYRVIGYSNANASLGRTLANITFKASSGIRDGIYPLNISNILLGRADGSEVKMDELQRNIIIGNVTAISSIPASEEQQPTVVYDLQGRKYNSASEIKSGLYISNGNKIIKK